MASKLFELSTKKRKKIESYLTKNICSLEDEGAFEFMGTDNFSGLTYSFYRGFGMIIDNKGENLSFYGKSTEGMEEEFSKLVELSEGY